jgi:hypothetical protein
MRLEPVNPGFGGLRRCLNAPDPGKNIAFSFAVLLLDIPNIR